ncbi:putative phytanoyl- dioxygenase protein [Botryosphaeria dothidea]|uniref:Phytanoyl- dioxygenase protein n=1 Tax=Botryosphaeria dothidea TaxID=55169 RepID=A0A8H4N4F6_9PEZI|nr:putative phytanoyl- dioxygenase protein [Botryosphaeria dothidea]
MPSQPLQPQPSGPNRLLCSEADQHHGDFRDDLSRDGFAIVKGAIPRARADQYADEMFSWLEGFNLGFDRHNPSTIHKDRLPHITEKGMVLHYAGTHERFAWAVRQEPGVAAAFARVYDTPDLLVSFDALNASFPNRADVAPNAPWPHQDQDPEKGGFRCLQGLVNLLPNGPADGGLIVCKGGHRVSEEYHEVMRAEGEERIPAWTSEWYGFKERGMKWLEEKGCKWEKLCAEPGDLLLWDSRTPHYNLSPAETSTQPRFAIYTCYMPVAEATQEDLRRKREAFEQRVGTTHWPNAKHVGSNVAQRDGKDDPHNRFKPVNEPVLEERGLKLIGLPYIQEIANAGDESSVAAAIDGPQTLNIQPEVAVGA